MASLQKNVAFQNMTFVLVNATTGAGLTGATVSAFVTKDGGSQASGGGTVSEPGHGQYNYAPTTAETNATDVGFLFTATNAVPTNLDFHTDQVDSNGFLKVDVVDIAGSTVSTSLAQLGVNVVNIAGQAAALDANNFLKVDVEDVAGATISTTTAQLGVNVVKYNNQTAATDTNNLPKVDVESVNASTGAAQNVSKANQAIGRGTCTSGGSATSVPTSAFTPNGVATGQFIGRTMIFDAGTATSALAGQATTITASTSAAAPTFTVVALTTAPVSGDTFGVY
jgi:phosphoribosylformylglycinamidine (FGAM) synthase PurS component